MQTTTFNIKGPILLTPSIHKDDRGDFIETFSSKLFQSSGLPFEFVQDNQSKSHKNVLRGLHYQKEPFAQGKLVRVTFGSALDVIVDIRSDSPTLGQHIKVVLDDSSCQMLWVPPGFAHGFLSLSDNTVFNYKCTQYYNRESECGICWNDKELGIDWGVDNPIVSDKDAKLPSFHSFLVEQSGPEPV